jgi:hypothetical protein
MEKEYYICSMEIHIEGSSKMGILMEKDSIPSRMDKKSMGIL